MKNFYVTIFLLTSIVVIAILVLQPIEQKKHSNQEMTNISEAFAEEYSKAQEAQKNQADQTAKPVATRSTEKDNQAPDQNPQTIIAVIYKHPGATWFVKAKDSKQKIDTISASFKNYFVEQLKFDENHQPIFSHIPDSMKTTNTSSMRVATYIISDVEISVSRLAGDQDVFANVQRWMKQIGLNDSAPIQLDISDDKKTIIVKMPK